MNINWVGLAPIWQSALGKVYDEDANLLENKTCLDNVFFWTK